MRKKIDLPNGVNAQGELDFKNRDEVCPKCARLFYKKENKNKHEKNCNGAIAAV